MKIDKRDLKKAFLLRTSVSFIDFKHCLFLPLPMISNRKNIGIIGKIAIVNFAKLFCKAQVLHLIKRLWKIL